MKLQINSTVMKIAKSFFIVLIVLAGGFVSAQQDTVYTSTGTELIGEIKSLSRNVLIFDTDYADSEFEIEWENVDGIIANSTLIIYTTDGERYTGNLKYNKNEKRVGILYNSIEDVSLSLNDIVQISTLSKSFWSRIYISIDAGFSFTKANNVRQFSTNSRTNYKADKWKLAGSYNNVATNQDSVDATTRTEGGLDYNYDVLGNVFAFVGIDFLKNSEKMLDLRTTSMLGAGYYIVRTNHLFFQAGLGLANANEKYGGDNPSTDNSFEGLGMFEFDAFDIGDFSFRTKVKAFPSFSNPGRIRINGDVSLKWDLPLDFYIKASYVHDFDSEPLIDVPTSDYVFQTTIGWEWD